MQFFDTISLGQAVEITGARETRNGSLVINARAARGGNVQDYLGVEVGKPEIGIVRVYRDADEIFNKDRLRTYGHKPVTLDHPAQPVTSRTWRDVACGHTGEDVLRDGEFIRIPMMVSDQVAIDAVKAGKRELSVGYQCNLDWTSGQTADGRAYDARQVNILVDHVAIVDRGRAGKDCRIGDGAPADDGKTMRVLPLNPPPLPQPIRDTVPMKMYTVDGHSVELGDAAAIAVASLQAKNGALTADNLRLTTDLNAANTAHAAAITAKDAELATANTAVQTKDGEIAALKQQVADAELTPAKLDAAVAARGKVVADAKRVAGDRLVVDGKTDSEIRREAVLARLGDSAKAFSDAEVNGAFLSMASQPAGADPARQAIISGAGILAADASATAYAEMCAGMDKAWKRPTQGVA